MSSRLAILAAITKNKPVSVEHPGEFVATTLSDPRLIFTERLALAGGQAVFVSPEKPLNEVIKQAFSEDVRILSYNEKVASTMSLPDTDRGFTEIDLVVLNGEVAVAENGAVWVSFTDSDARRASLLAQNVALVVKLDHLVESMHDAMKHPAFLKTAIGQGAFLSGPSKTADIEQCLVIGAHGPCALRVFLV